MNVTDNLKKVIEDIVIPEYDFLDSVEIKTYGGMGDIYFYEIYFFLKEGINDIPLHLSREVAIETQSLYSMMSLPKGNDLSVLFTPYEAKKYFKHPKKR